MIDDAIDYITREVVAGLDLPAAEVILGDIGPLKEDHNQRGIYICLVNLQEEHTLKNMEHHVGPHGSLNDDRPGVCNAT